MWGKLCSCAFSLRTLTVRTHPSLWPWETAEYPHDRVKYQEWHLHCSVLLDFCTTVCFSNAGLCYCDRPSSNQGNCLVTNWWVGCTAWVQPREEVSPRWDRTAQSKIPSHYSERCPVRQLGVFSFGMPPFHVLFFWTMIGPEWLKLETLNDR